MNRVLATRIFPSSTICALALSISPFLYGQATGTLSGTALDKSAANISGATVTATPQGTNLSRNSQTDDAGHCVIPRLSVGMYTLQVAFGGFQSAERQDVGLQIDDFVPLATLIPGTTQDLLGNIFNPEKSRAGCLTVGAVE